MEDSSLYTWQFHITGQVQGVGFRPHVYRIANRLSINGFVSNDMDGVNIQFTSTPSQATNFVAEILNSAPSLSHILNSELNRIDFKKFEGFSISQIPSTTKSKIAITPDFALCKDCRNDLELSRRKNYPFTSCTQCGPRYSIIQKLPFERHHTSMQRFELCNNCSAEYSDQADRRFYAQTISLSLIHI